MVFLIRKNECIQNQQIRMTLLYRPIQVREETGSLYNNSQETSPTGFTLLKRGALLDDLWFLYFWTTAAHLKNKFLRFLLWLNFAWCHVDCMTTFEFRSLCIDETIHHHSFLSSLLEHLLIASNSFPLYKRQWLLLRGNDSNLFLSDYILLSKL